MIKNIWYVLTQPFRRIYWRTNCLLYWFPIIWKDNDWDNYYLYKILQKKMHRMRRYFETQGITSHSGKELRRMQICESLLQRLIDEEYLDNFVDPTWYKECHMMTNINNWPSMRYRVNYQGMHRKYVHDHEEHLIRQDLELFCKLFQKYVRTWWD